VYWQNAHIKRMRNGRFCLQHAWIVGLGYGLVDDLGNPQRHFRQLVGTQAADVYNSIASVGSELVALFVRSDDVSTIGQESEMFHCSGHSR